MKSLIFISIFALLSTILNPTLLGSCFKQTSPSSIESEPEDSTEFRVQPISTSIWEVEEEVFVVKESSSTTKPNRKYHTFYYHSPRYPDISYKIIIPPPDFV